jgi:hypothetical protein
VTLAKPAPRVKGVRSEQSAEDRDSGECHADDREPEDVLHDAGRAGDVEARVVMAVNSVSSRPVPRTRGRLKDGDGRLHDRVSPHCGSAANTSLSGIDIHDLAAGNYDHGEYHIRTFTP